MTYFLSIYSDDGASYIGFWKNFLDEYYPKSGPTFWSDGGRTLNWYANPLSEYGAKMRWGRGINFDTPEELLRFVLEWS